MNDLPSLSPVELLVLTRLLPVGEKGETPAKIQKDLEPLLEHRWSGSVLTSQLERVLIKLVSVGLVAHRPVKSKRATPPLELTSNGRETILAFLSVKQLPARPKPTWGKLKHSLLLAPALGLPGPGQALSKDDGFRAIMLKRQFGLPLGDYPTLRQSKAEWVRKALGMGEKEKITLETIQTALLRRELGESRAVDSKRVVDRLAARHLGARRDDLKEVRDEVLRSWIDQRSVPTTPATKVSAAPSVAAFDLSRFVAYVLDAASASPTGRYGDSKVFIVHVWRALRGNPEFRGMGLQSFKDRLTEASNARLLDLSRADLVQAMDPEDVRLSQVNYLNATFHFIRVDPEQEPRR
jgi:hypothetical protein